MSRRFQTLLHELSLEYERLSKENLALASENVHLRVQAHDHCSAPRHTAPLDANGTLLSLDSPSIKSDTSRRTQQDLEVVPIELGIGEPISGASPKTKAPHPCFCDSPRTSRELRTSSAHKCPPKPTFGAEEASTTRRRSTLISGLTDVVAKTAVSAKQNRLVINPERSRFLQKWNVITMTALVFVAFVTPVQIALVPLQVNAFFVVSCTVDAVFLIDLFLQFFIMYPRESDRGITHEHRHVEIVRHYLKTWFAVDLLSVIPFDLVSLLSDTETGATMKAVKIIRLLRLLKLARVLRASRVIRRVEVSSSISYGRLDLFKFFAYLLMITHWLANLWALTLVLVEEGDNVPRWIDGIDAMEQKLVNKTKDTPWKLYLTCLYFTSYTITSVGYGDIGPMNIVEIFVATFMIVVSGISWAIVLGQVCGIVANMNPYEQNFRRTMDELNVMMHDRVMPRLLRERLRSFFLSNKRAWRNERHLHIIASMSPGLQGEVVMEMNRKWIAKVSFLKQFIDGARHSREGHTFAAFMVDVSRQMEPKFHAQSELFGVPQELYILIRGLAIQGPRGVVRSSGTVWGQDFVLSDVDLVECPGAFALTYLELTTLTRSAFVQVVEQHGAACPKLKAQVRRFCCWVAFQRAMMREAKLRQERLALSLTDTCSEDSGTPRSSTYVTKNSWSITSTSKSGFQANHQWARADTPQSPRDRCVRGSSGGLLLKQVVPTSMSS
mmetsp:Transcript_38785/g.97481  ORF Transcript_38785/g.97481 Transcript_38785/m.97481 type:complete len:724 (-) Transcript_38785:32-2203(-)